MATIAELLYLFRDGQADKTIGPEAFQALISELHLATGFFQDMPRSPAGLADGRLYLNGDVVQRAPGSAPASPLGNFNGVGSAVLIADVSFTRAAARSSLLGTTSLFADPVAVKTAQTIDFIGSGAATLFADPSHVVIGQAANSVISGAAALSTAPKLWTPGVFLASGVAAFSADTAPPTRAGISTPAGAGGLAAGASFARMAAGSIATGSAALAAAPWSKVAGLSTVGGAAALAANPTVRNSGRSTMAGSAGLSATLVKTTQSFSSGFSTGFA